MAAGNTRRVARTVPSVWSTGGGGGSDLAAMDAMRRRSKFVLLPAALLGLLALAACDTLNLRGTATDHGAWTRARAGIPF
jgi:hypothetical protein